MSSAAAVIGKHEINKIGFIGKIIKSKIAIRNDYPLFVQIKNSMLRVTSSCLDDSFVSFSVPAETDGNGFINVSGRTFFNFCNQMCDRTRFDVGNKSLRIWSQDVKQFIPKQQQCPKDISDYSNDGNEYHLSGPSLDIINMAQNFCGYKPGNLPGVLFNENYILAMHDSAILAQVDASFERLFIREPYLAIAMLMASKSGHITICNKHFTTILEGNNFYLEFKKCNAYHNIDHAQIISQIANNQIDTYAVHPSKIFRVLIGSGQLDSTQFDFQENGIKINNHKIIYADGNIPQNNKTIVRTRDWLYGLTIFDDENIVISVDKSGQYLIAHNDSYSKNIVIKNHHIVRS